MNALMAMVLGVSMAIANCEAATPPEPSFRLQCVRCSRVMEFYERYRGRVGECSRCGKRVRLPVIRRVKQIIINSRCVGGT